MFVSMWMTRELITVDPTATLAHIATILVRHKIRRLPVVSPSPEGLKLLGIVSHSDVLHAFPTNINPAAINAAGAVAELEMSGVRKRIYAADLMARDPLTTTPDAPLEAAARLMRDHKIGALPVVSNQSLVGLITESDIFRALLEVFEAPDQAVRVTFSLRPGEDVLPLVADIARRRAMRVTSFIALPGHDPPVCVAQLAGIQAAEALEDIWKSKHRVIHVVNLAPEGEAGKPAT